MKTSAYKQGFDIRVILGYLALALITSITLAAFYGLLGFSHSHNQDWIDWSLLSDPYLHTVLWFSVKQAGLSALFSVLLAWPVARALYYLKLPFERAFLSLCLLCFVLPTLVLITGLVILFGRTGIITPLLGADWNLYGLNGILLAHIFLNMPFAIRGILQQLHHIPDTSWRLAAQLKLSSWQRFWFVEWVSVKPVLLTLFVFIAVLCFNSFAVVLALGGGPQSTTLEVAIYQALKYDFNIPEALTLAWLQLLIAGGLYFIASRFTHIAWLSMDTPQHLWKPQPSFIMRTLHRLFYVITWIFLLLPLCALLIKLFRADNLSFDLLPLLQPLLVSISLGIGTALASCILAYLTLLLVRSSENRFTDWLAVHTLFAPAMVLSVGLYILLLTRIDLEYWGMFWVGLLNTAVILPFAIQQLRPRVLLYDRQYQALCLSLKLSAWTQIKLEWPWLKRAWWSSLSLALLLAIGDVAIFAIFGNNEWKTLPWLIYSYAGTYRMDEAALASLVLLVLCGSLVWWLEYLGNEKKC